MFKKTAILFLIIFACISCKKKDNSNKPTTNISDVPNDQHVSVLTQHNDNTRAGWNSHETKLTTTNVNSKTFGKLFSLTVHDQVYAQPLVFGNLTIIRGPHNVVFVATVNNTVYAYDRESGKPY